MVLLKSRTEFAKSSYGTPLEPPDIVKVMLMFVPTTDAVKLVIQTLLLVIQPLVLVLIAVKKPEPVTALKTGPLVEEDGAETICGFGLLGLRKMSKY